MTDSDPQTWRDIMEVNLFGAFHLAQFVVPSMQQRGDGRLIFVNCGASTDPPPTLGAYAASKAALASLVRTLAVELGPTGIRANGIQLGPMTGENFRGYVEDLARRAGRTYDEELALWNAAVPAARDADAGGVCGHGALSRLGSGAADHGPEHRGQQRSLVRELRRARLGSWHNVASGAACLGANGSPLARPASHLGG